MLFSILVSIIIIAICTVLLGFRIFFVKDGKFPSSHIGDNKELQKKGIHCVKSSKNQY